MASSLAGGSPDAFAERDEVGGDGHGFEILTTEDTEGYGNKIESKGIVPRLGRAKPPRPRSG
jgi:hypothetical protein